MIEATPGCPVPLSRPQYDDYVAECAAAPDQRRLEHIAGVVGSPDPTAAALRKVLADYPPHLIGG